jgi:hypothetical protein
MSTNPGDLDWVAIVTSTVLVEHVHHADVRPGWDSQASGLVGIQFG